VQPGRAYQPPLAVAAGAKPAADEDGDITTALAAACANRSAY